MVNDSDPGNDEGLDDTPDLDATEQQGDDTDEGAGDDPVALLTARLAALEGAHASTQQSVAKMASSVGRVPGLVRELQSLAAKNPTADIQPRLDEVTDLLDAIIDNLDDVAFKDGGSASLAQRRSALVQKRATERLRAEIIAEVKPQITTPDNTDDDGGIEAPAAEFVAAQGRLLGYAEALGVDITAVPTTTLAFEPGETIAAAEVRVKAAIKSLAEGSQAAGRTAERKAAAGQGSAARGGGATSDEALITRYGNGEALSAEEKKRVEALLVGVLG